MQFIDRFTTHFSGFSVCLSFFLINILEYSYEDDSFIKYAIAWICSPLFRLYRKVIANWNVFSFITSIAHVLVFFLDITLNK